MQIALHQAINSANFLNEGEEAKKGFSKKRTMLILERSRIKSNVGRRN
jgi:hypothetical protein